jgi:predicted nucleic acid-binding protein
MIISDIPKNTRVVLDTDIFIYAMQGLSGQCRTLLERCATGEIDGILSSGVMTEIMHVLMIAEAKDNGWVHGSNGIHELKSQPKRVASLRRYESLVRDLLGMGLTIEDGRREDFITAMDVQQRSGFLMRDALLVALCRRLGVHAIASADPGLQRALDIQIYSPADVK